MSEVQQPGLLQPPEWPWIDDPNRALYGGILVCNYEGEGVNERVAQRLPTEQRLAEFAARNFHGICWYADGRFHAAVCQFHVHVATLSADTPDELMRVVNDAYGWS